MQMQKQTNFLLSILISGFFVGIMLSDCLSGDRLFSPNENRILAKKPELTIPSVMNKSYMQDYEAYVTDQFIWRDRWIMLKTSAELMLQKKNINGVYIGKDNYLIEQHTTEDILAYNPQQKAEKLAALLEQYEAELGRDRVKAMLVPTTDTILSEKLPLYAECFDQRTYLAEIAADTDGLIDVADTLTAHRSEYIYYKTDHHWTTLGAYYAYIEWAKAMQFSAWEMEEFEIETISEDFYGTIYSKINMAKEADSIQRFLPKQSAAYQVYYDKEDEASDSLYEMKHLSTKNQYAVFLDDNHPLIRIHTDNTNGRHLLLIKDSYANCFVPFAVNHYETVCIIDMRYYRGNIEDIVTEYQITDMLVLYDVIHFIENFR